MKHHTFLLDYKDGRKVFFNHWTTEGEKKGTILLVHGLGEHSGRYHHVAEYFTARGFEFLAPDTFGHGKTEGPKGYTKSMEDYLDLIDFTLEKCGLNDTGLPNILYGHSMGGLIALMYEQKRTGSFSAMMITSPALAPGFKVPALKLLAGKIGKAIMPSLTQPNGLEVRHLSHDQDVINAYLNDPLVHDKLSALVGMGILEWGEWYQNHAESVIIPTLVMQGTEDKITNFKINKEKFTQMDGDIQFVEWPGYFHELHNEDKKRDVFDKMYEWLSGILKKA